jgi:uncharacterized OsmC-like protein
MVVKSRSRGFTLRADEPRNIGGTNTSVNPVEMLLCALGSCQCIAARLLAPSQGIDLKEFHVSVEGDINPEGFLRGKEVTRPGFQEIRLKINVKADAPRDKIDSFVAFIQSRCPVGETVMNGVRIMTESHVPTE